MQYFVYCPMEMTEYEALAKAEPHLREDSVVVVRPTSIAALPLNPGARPRALTDTYLVRVEQDRSLRILERNIGD